MRREQRVTRPRPLPELLLIAGLFLAYKLGRVAISGHVDEAYANATSIWHLERLLHLPSEAVMQHAVLHWTWLIHGADIYYAAVHFPATAALLVWTWWRRPHLYRWSRTMLASLTAGSFVVHWLVPLAPPRLLQGSGMIDTGALIGPSVYGNPTTDTLSNQFAAMPSLHVGWAAAVAVTMIAATRTRWRWLWLAYPAATFAVVLLTANHYWLDGIVVLAMLGIILLVVRAPARSAEGSTEVAHELAERADAGEGEHDDDGLVAQPTHHDREDREHQLGNGADDREQVAEAASYESVGRDVARR